MQSCGLFCPLFGLGEMSKDDDLSSVRVEFDDDGSQGSPDAPEVSSQSSSGGSKWVLGLAAVAAVAVVVTVLALRPSGDEAADGSERSVPTTTTTTVLEEAPELVIADEASAIQVVNAVSAVSRELAPDSIDADFGWIEATDDGFIGLPVGAEAQVSATGFFIAPEVGASATPQIFTSDSGFDWELAETAVTANGEPLDQEYLWGELHRLDSGLILSGLDPDTRLNDLFLSNDGLNWERVEAFGQSGGSEASSIPLVVLDDAVLGLEIVGNQRLSEVLEEHTNFEVPADGVCVVDGSFVDDEGRGSLAVFGCVSGLAPTGVSDLDITSDASPEEVFDCAIAVDDLGPFTRTVAWTLTDRNSGESGRLADPMARVTVGDIVPTGRPTAFVDLGRERFTGSAVCDGVIDLPEEQRAAVIYTEPDTFEVERIELPEQIEDDLLESARVIGPVTADDGRRLLVVEVGGPDDLWLHDVQTGQWALLGGSDRESSESLHVISESGNRIYGLSEEAITAHDLDFSVDGVTRVQSTMVTLGGGEIFGGGGRLNGVGKVLFANDETIWFADGDQLFALDTPAIAEPIDPDAPTVSAQLVDNDGLLSEVLEADVGFVALGERGDILPPILRSVDGLDWFEVETVLADSFLDDAQADSVFWFDLTREDDGFSVRAQVTGSDTEQPRQTVVYSSLQSGSWRLRNIEQAPAGSADLFVRTVDVDGFTVYSEELGDLVLAEVLNTHTNLGLDDTPLCGSFVGVGNGISIQTCDNELVRLGAPDVESEFPFEQVLSCISVLGERSVRTTQSLRVDQTSGDVESFAGSEVAFGLIGTTTLSRGMIGTIDIGDTLLGSPEFTASLEARIAVCDGIADLEPARVPSVLIMDVDNLSVRRIPLPDAIDVIQFGFLTQVLGELESEDGVSSRVIVGIDNELWALDVETETWTELIDSPPVERGERASVFSLSTSGDRAYRFEVGGATSAPRALTVVDLALETNGSLSVGEAMLLLDVEGDTGLGPGRVTTATDDVVFYRDFSGDTDWLLTIPELVE